MDIESTNDNFEEKPDFKASIKDLIAKMNQPNAFAHIDFAAMFRLNQKESHLIERLLPPKDLDF